MTYKEYFENHPDENIGWCKPYTDETGDYFLVMYDGETISAVKPYGKFQRPTEH